MGNIDVLCPVCTRLLTVVIVTLAELLFFPLASLPLKLSRRGFGSPEMRKSFLFEFPLCGECRSWDLGWSRRITICQEPTRMVRPMRIRNFMRSRTAKIDTWKLIKVFSKIGGPTPHYIEVEDSSDILTWETELSIVNSN